jgi:hypothetical protein
LVVMALIPRGESIALHLLLLCLVDLSSFRSER